MALDWPPPELDEPSQPAPYRVYKNLTSACREVISNAIRHAGAAQVAVTVRHTKERLDMTISDDGVGLTGSPPRLGCGLSGMHERVAAAGGSLHIASHSGAGTTLHLSLPLPDCHDEALLHR